MLNLTRILITITAFFAFTLTIKAQPLGNPSIESATTAKPYRILTSGKQITIKSTRDIKSVMVWSSAGERILEQKDINDDNYNFRLTTKEKIVFVRLQLADGKVYAEKIGLQP